MADLIRKTQFEKIVPFPVLKEIMEATKELEGCYSKINFIDLQRDLQTACEAFLICSDKEDALELAASVILYLCEIHKVRTFKPDS